MRHLLIALAWLAAAPAYAADSVDRIGWLPPEIDFVMASPIKSAPLLRYLSSTLSPAPACFGQQLATLDAFYQVQEGMASNRAIQLVHGKIDRAAFERCVTDVAPKLQLGTHVALRKDGALTEITVDHHSAWFGFTGDWVVYNDDRDRVAHVLAATSGHTLRPAVASLLRRCQPGSDLCAALATDLVGPILGVPSQGAIIQAATGDKPTGGAIVYFKDGKEAERAVAVLRRIAKDPARSEDMRRFVTALAPSVRDNTMLVDIAGVMGLSTATMQAVVTELKASRDAAAPPR